MLGTVQYMAPEQLEGKAVDHRADLFAFGALLYEMLTGKRAFEGRSQASVIASILKEDPRPVSQLVPTTPVSLDRVVKSCLAKDPDERWQSAGDLSRELRWIAEGVAPASGAPAAVAARHTGRVRVAWILVGVASIAAVAAMALLATRTRSAAPHGALSRFSIGSLANATLLPDGVNARISLDGRTLAFLAASATGTVSFWVRPLESLTARPLVGTDDGLLPFWSPDSRYLAYFGNNKLREAPIAAGAPEIICNVGSGRGASWGHDGVIVFAPESAGPLYRVRESGGEVAQVTVLDETRQETGHRWPCFLPDGKHFLFVALPAKQGNFDVFVGSIDSKERKFLLAASSAPVYAEPGYLIYMRDNTIVAHRFDTGRLATTGEPVSLGEAPAPSDWTGAAVVSASNDGGLARWGMGLPNTILQWYDPGKSIGDIPVPAGRYEEVRLSPDGRRLAVDRRSSGSAMDIWLLDLDRPAPSRFTFGPSISYSVAWSPDGSRIAFASDRFGPEDISVKSTDGATEETVVLEGGALFKEPSSWSADGKAIVFDRPDAKSGWDIELVPQDGKSEPVPLVHTPFAERRGVVSPDGKWLAYHSDEAGRMELFVQSFPGPGAKYQVSSGGSNSLTTRWTRGGKELMFQAGDRLTVMAADVTTGAAFRAGAPRELFKLRSDVVGVEFAPDGERILAAVPAGQPQAHSITLEMNWVAAMTR
jgi:Tol biopolymer transport system component